MVPEAVRRRVLDVTGSFLVQAPAGSGKTELLTQRFLALLGVVEQPESIVAITFTKKAAAEMRGRITRALEMARGPEPAEPHRQKTWQLARTVLGRGWNLIENPARLRVQTFDSFCRSLVSQMPWLSRCGAPPEVSQEPAELHWEAALRALRSVEQGNESAARLLLHLDNQYHGVAEKLAEMLARRDQWLRHLSADREELEAALSALCDDHLEQLRRHAPSSITADSFEEWQQVAMAALTKSGSVSKRWMKATGASEQFAELLERPLSPPCFSDEQWRIVTAIFDMLRLATAELKLLFRERRQVDFSEIAMAALTALGNDEQPTPLAEALYYRVEHLLVDEFQDTSASQYYLLQRLTADWEQGDGRTLFLVGDPMQSIYGFREANVGLFLRAAEEGIGNVPLEYQQLTSNFRSGRQLVDWFNEAFPGLLAAEADAETGAVPYVPCEATRDYEDCGMEVVWGEAAAVADLIDRHPTEKIAVLVRSRTHATPIVRELQRRGTRFQAIDLYALGEQPAVRDLEALTRTLLHPEDQVAWLAVCRAPWGGATLAQLAAGEPPARVREIVERGRAERGRGSLREQVERLWLELGGPATLTSDGDWENCCAFFDLLDTLDDTANLTEELTKLYARPDPLAGDRVQIMTMHKAKGLEFDVVILPGLERSPGQDRPSLLRWRMASGELLLGCIRETGSEKDPIYEAIREYDKRKMDFEKARLLYVACTRAKRKLYLVSACRKTPQSNSLAALLGPEIAEAWLAQVQDEVETDTVPRQVLRRFVPGWQTPAPPPPMSAPVLEAVAEAVEAKREDGALEVRAIGTVTHRILQRIAKEGLEHWPLQRLEAIDGYLRASLSSLGVPGGELKNAVERCREALRRALTTERGRWILASHTESRCEWELSGMIGGKVHNVILDRTFVDAEGTRWIIDYKTGSADAAYRTQLDRYAQLLAAAESRPIRLGLYYIMQGTWDEWAFASSVQPAEAVSVTVGG